MVESLASEPATTCRRLGHATRRFLFAIPFLLLLPQFGFLLIFSYPVPPATLIVSIELLPTLLSDLRRGMLAAIGFGVTARMLLFWSYCLLSAGYGYLSLQAQGREVLQLGDIAFPYLPAALGRVVQLFMAFAAFEFLRRTDHPSPTLLNAWLAGLLIAVFVHLFGNLLSFDFFAARAGTFPEGNQAGLFYVISVLLALEYWHQTHRKTSIVFATAAFLGLLLSQSTAGFIALIFVLVVRTCVNARTARSLAGRLVALVSALVVVALVFQATSLGDAFTEKLFEEEVNANSFSRIDRLASAAIGIDLFTDSPVLGQGLQSYGFLSNDRLEGPLASVYEGTQRRIVNNIYVEVASELGIVGLALFALVLISIWRLASRAGADSRWNYRCGILAVLLYWMAFPTYSVTFVWAFFGLASRAGTLSREPARTRGRSPVSSPAAPASR